MTKEALKALAEDLAKLAKARGCTGVVIALSSSDGSAEELPFYVQHSAGFEALAIALAALRVIEGKPFGRLEFTHVARPLLGGGGGAGVGEPLGGATGGNGRPLQGGAGGGGGGARGGI